MIKPKTLPACGNFECGVSTGIHDDDDGLTFGSGKLDFNGYWEKPCAACAREHERRDGKPVGTYWPFPAVLTKEEIKKP